MVVAKWVGEVHGTRFLHKNAIVDECSLGRLGGHAFNHYILQWHLVKWVGSEILLPVHGHINILLMNVLTPGFMQKRECFYIISKFTFFTFAYNRLTLATSLNFYIWTNNGTSTATKKSS